MTGRPTKYRDTYPEALIEFMGNGFSFEAFAGEIGVAEETLYAWTRNGGPDLKPAFSEAKKLAFAKNRLFWEGKGIEGIHNKEFNATTWIFNMKNRFHWKDKHEISGNKDAPFEVHLKDLREKPEAEVDAIIKQSLIDGQG